MLKNSLNTLVILLFKTSVPTYVNIIVCCEFIIIYLDSFKIFLELSKSILFLLLQIFDANCHIRKFVSKFKFFWTQKFAQFGPLAHYLTSDLVKNLRQYLNIEIFIYFKSTQLFVISQILAKLFYIESFLKAALQKTFVYFPKHLSILEFIKHDDNLNKDDISSEAQQLWMDIRKK